MVSSTGRAMTGSRHSRWRTSSNIIAPTITSTGAVAALGMIPAKGEMNRQHGKGRPVTTEARPVRPPSPMPAELSMNVVFDDADAAPPAAAATESTSSTRRIPGSPQGAPAQPAPPPGAPPARRHEAGPAAQPEHGAGGVEEVRQHHGDHDGDSA